MSAANPRISMRGYAWSLLLLPLLLTGCASQAKSAAPTDDSPSGSSGVPTLLTHDLRVVSYNIRWPNPDDGADRWDRRRHRVTQTITRLRPDVLGVQEAYAFQADYLLTELPGYARVCAGRDDGGLRGEMTAVYLREDRLDLVDHGHLWLSDTPDMPGSVGWDADLTRMATWAVARDRRTGHPWLFVNTHFDHRGATARIESARLLGRFIRGKLAELGQDTSAVLMGDFNAAVDSAPYLALCAAPSGPQLIDTYRASRRPGEAEPEGTFNGFRNRNGGARIDWVLVSPGVSVRAAGIDRRLVDGRNPSDHHPVWADLRR